MPERIRACERPVWFSGVQLRARTTIDADWRDHLATAWRLAGVDG